MGGFFLTVSCLLTGCSQSHVTFDSKFQQIKSGDTQAEVQLLIGTSWIQEKITAPDVGLMGPQEALFGLVEPGTPLEEWKYQIKQTVYYVWFQENPEQTSQPMVVTTMSHPADAVF